MSTVSILNLPIQNVTMAEAVADVAAFFEERKSRIVVTPNAEILQAYANDEGVRRVLLQADYVIPDGIGVVLASRLLKTPVKEKVAGVELAEHLLRYSAEKGKRVYFLGAKPGVAEAAKEKLVQKYPDLHVAGLHDGYFKPEDEGEIIEEINGLDIDMLFVCLGAPRQETWMAENRARLKVGVMLGLGGSLDVFAGAVKRAPRWMIRLGLEWLYRICKEPWRLKRVMELPFFLMSIKRRAKKMK